MTNPYDPNSAAPQNEGAQPGSGDFNQNPYDTPGDNTNQYGNASNPAEPFGTENTGSIDSGYGVDNSVNYGTENTADYGAGSQDYTSGVAGYGAGASGYGGFENSPMAEGKNSLAPWALGVGIVSILCAISVFLTGFAAIPGLIGLILGIVALGSAKKYQHKENKRKGMAITGLVLSILSIIATVVFWIFVTFVFKEAGLQECMTVSDPAAQQECVNQKMEEAVGSTQ